MGFFGVITPSANRSFLVHFRDIQICLESSIRPVFTGGFLRVARRLAPSFALFVSVVFCIHCFKPYVSHWPAMLKRQPHYNTVATDWGTPFSQTGIASWYGGQHGHVSDGFGYRKTASGEIMDPDAYVCAHRTLPFGTILEVENLSNGRRTLLRVNDRGPFVRGRILDISMRAAKEIGLLDQGVGRVHIQVAKCLLKTNALAAAPDARSSAKPLLYPWIGFESLNLGALFFSLVNPIIPPEKKIILSPFKQLSSVAHDIEETIRRLKRLRVAPFINREI